VSALLASVAAYTVLFILLVAGAEHLSEPAALSRALAAHRVIPAPATVAALAIAGEGLLGAAGIAALLRDDAAPALTAVLAGAAALLALYGGYALHVRSIGRAGPCGCSRLDLPMTGWVAARALVLAALALVALVLCGAIVPLTRFGAPLAIALLAAATFAALLWHLPAAMHEPTLVPGRRDVTRGGVPG
jgi:hypothetical protein